MAVIAPSLGLPTPPPRNDQVGSTLVFDAEQLQAVADEAASSGGPTHEARAALAPFCITTKRMRLQPALQSPVDNAPD